MSEQLLIETLQLIKQYRLRLQKRTDDSNIKSKATWCDRTSIALIEQLGPSHEQKRKKR